MIEELEPIGVEMGTVDSEEEKSLAKKCGISFVPTLILLIEGKVYTFKDHQFNIQRIVNFIKSKFPYKLIVNVNNDNINTFLTGWKDNKVRALIFGKNELVRLRYLLMAFYYFEEVYFG